jgi:hypothetical protein
MIAMAARLLADMPRPVFDARMTIIQNETPYAFSRWLHANGSLTPKNQASFDAMVTQLIDFMSAGLCAPVADGG